MLKQYDIVQIITTKRINYLSGPAGQSTSPNGNWSIVGFIGKDTIIAKEDTLARVPIGDLRKIASLSTESFMNEVSKAGYLKTKLIDMPEHISNIYNIDLEKSRKLLRDHNYNNTVTSKSERDMIVQQIAKVING